MYKEPITALACQCPPVSAAATSNAIGYRLVQNIPASDSDFRSHAALGKKKPPDLDDCSWHSCSLFVTPTKLQNAQGLPIIKGTAWKGIVRVALDKSSGPISQNDKGHIHWWPYNAFPITKYCSVEKAFP